VNADRIQELADLLPEDCEYFSRFWTDNDTTLERDIGRFLTSYKDLAFGYHFVRYLVQLGKKLPPVVDEEWLTNLYYYEKHGTRDDTVLKAVSIHHPSNYFQENSLKAFLLTDSSFKEISVRTGIHEDTIAAYEQLFFNIRDRRDEALFIAETVYPEHRVVETQESYLKNVDPGSFLIRSAYNNGIEDVSYFIGLKVDQIVNSDNANEMASKLEGYGEWLLPG